VPELVELPPAEAGEIYSKIRQQVWRCGEFWRGMIAPGLLFFVVYPLVASVWNWGAGIWIPMEFVPLVDLIWVVALTAGLPYVLKPMLLRANAAALRRLARIEVGTHCADCDYDLRATRDRSGPGGGGCPEWGGVVGERVREYGVMGEG